MATKVKTGVLGTLTELNFADNGKARFGAGADLQIYHDGSNSHIKDTGTGDLLIEGSDNIWLMQSGGAKVFLNTIDSNAINLYYNNSKKLETTNTGIAVTGTTTTTNLTINDGVQEFDKPSVKGFRFLHNDAGNDLSIQQGDTNNANYVTKFNINTSGNATFAGTINTTGLTAQTGGTAGIADVVSFNASGNGGSGRGTGILIKAPGSSNAVSVARIAGLQNEAAGSANNAALVFQVAATNGTLTERMRIEADGDAAFAANATGAALIKGVSGNQADRDNSGYPQYTFVGNEGTGMRRVSSNILAFDSSGAERMRIDANGNVGIGTGSPAKLGLTGSSAGKVLELSGDDSQVRIGNSILHHDNSANTYFHIRNHYGATSSAAELSLESGYISFNVGTSFTERMRLDASGNLLVGKQVTNTNTNGLTVSLNDFMSYTNSSTDSGDRCLILNRHGVSAGDLQEFRTQNSTRGIISFTGSVINYGGTSDYRLKENIKPMENGLDRLNRLNPVSFDWKETGINSEGFIAHEVQEVFADAVTGQKDGEQMQNVDYGRITPLLVKAIQEQQAQIDELKAKLESK